MDDEISDENLMLSYCNGDADAFEVLYQRHKGPLYRFILRQSGQQFVEELFQDIWLKVINSRMSYQVKATFKTWLYRIARNRIIDHYRRQNMRPVDNNSESLPAISGAESIQPENQLEAGNQHELLMRAIAELPRDQKEAFLLKQEAGLDIEQIADTTGVSYEAAKSRLRYAFNRLRDQLESIHEHR
jgi:RNA polymerase sigma-70 factor (ECF subfamily)